MNVVLFPRFNQLDLEAPGTFPLSFVNEKSRVFKTRGYRIRTMNSALILRKTGKSCFSQESRGTGKMSFKRGAGEATLPMRISSSMRPVTQICVDFC